MAITSEKKQELHDRGEKDASREKGYNTPYGIGYELIFGWGKNESKKISESNAAYRAGYLNTKNQKK